MKNERVFFNLVSTCIEQSIDCFFLLKILVLAYNERVCERSPFFDIFFVPYSLTVLYIYKGISNFIYFYIFENLKSYRSSKDEWKSSQKFHFRF